MEFRSINQVWQRVCRMRTIPPIFSTAAVASLRMPWSVNWIERDDFAMFRFPNSLDGNEMADHARPAPRR
jgi:hypothetical protein